MHDSNNDVFTIAKQGFDVVTHESAMLAALELFPMIFSTHGGGEPRLAS